MNRRRAERSGRRAETVAAWWLRLKGWKILARRVRTPLGEVDLVARRGGTVAFVEVKSRPSLLEAEFSLDEYRLRRVAAASQLLAARYARSNDEIRIDAIFIVPRRLPSHRSNIFIA